MGEVYNKNGLTSSCTGSTIPRPNGRRTALGKEQEHQKSLPFQTVTGSRSRSNITGEQSLFHTQTNHSKTLTL